MEDYQDFYEDASELMKRMMRDVRQFQEALIELVGVLTNPDTSKQKAMVNTKLAAMLKITRAVISTYDMSSNDQLDIISCTSTVLALVKTYNKAWEELENRTTVRRNNKLKHKRRTSDPSNPSKISESTLEKAVSDAITIGVSPDAYFDLQNTQLYDNLVASIDELALTFSNAVARHLTALEAPSLIHDSNQLGEGGDDEEPDFEQKSFSPGKLKVPGENASTDSSPVVGSEGRSRSPQVEINAVSASSPVVSVSPALWLGGIEIEATDVHQVDRILAGKENGVERAIERVKQTTKFSTVLINFIDSRIKSIVDYGKALSRSIKDYQSQLSVSAIDRFRNDFFCWFLVDFRDLFVFELRVSARLNHFKLFWTRCFIKTKLPLRKHKLSENNAIVMSLHP